MIAKEKFRRWFYVALIIIIVTAIGYTIAAFRKALYIMDGGNVNGLDKLAICAQYVAGFAGQAAITLFLIGKILQRPTRRSQGDVL